MKALNVLHLYRVRLRARALQECFAVAGIAAGVALLFASQVASSSLQSSVAQLSSGIVGKASLQLLARDAQGMEEGLLRKVRAIPSVKLAVPLLETNANAIGPKGHESVELVGADSSLSKLGGTLVQHTNLNPFAGIGAIVLPKPLSKTIGVTKFGQEATLQVAGKNTLAPLYEQLSAKQIGPLIESPIAIAPLFFAQEVAGLQGRISRILVAPRPGGEAQARAALERIAAGRLNVESTGYDEQLFAKASEATNQSTALFAVISALVGFLFAFNAMLLTVPQRRRLIADLRRDGYTPRAVIAVLLLDALVLGVIACVLGLILGEELSIHLFHSTPGYLSSAFAVGSQRVVSTQSVVIALGGGLLAAIVAVLSPLRDILSHDPLAAITDKDGAGTLRGTRWLALGGLVCLAAATVVLAAAPKQAVLGMIFLVGALLTLLPLPLNGTLALVRRVAPLVTSAVPHIATMELRAARARAIAIAATGAIAVFGSVAIQGAHSDLLHGLDNAARDMNAYGSIWVSPAGTYNLLTTAPFNPTEQAKIEKVQGVRSVGVYRGGLLDYGQRRVWVIAPPQSGAIIPPTQLVEGGLQQADRRLSAGGWVVLSQAIASEHDLHIGSTFTLPSPDPRSFRVAGLSTNVGWAPGAIIMNASDYAKAWGSEDPSAYTVTLRPGVSVNATMRQLRKLLGPSSGLAVQSGAAREERQRTLSRQGLQRLSQIATLILVAAVLAMAAAMGNMVWQRRPRLAKLKLEGFPRAELWRTIMLESLLLLGVGCLTGAVFGLYGQQLLDRALANVIDFPVVYSFGVVIALVNLAVVTAAAVAMAALPGYLATSVAPAVALQD